MATYPQKADFPRRRPFNTVSYLSFTQGLYYFLSGIWPLINLAAPVFAAEARDPWMTAMLSIFLMSTGAVLIVAGWKRREPLGEIALLAVMTAAGLATVDIVEAAVRPDRGIYLADAGFQAGLIVLWGMVWRRRGEWGG